MATSKLIYYFFSSSMYECLCTLYAICLPISYSEELDKRTKETQRLQEELENATKLTLERFGGMYIDHSSPSSPGQTYNIHDFSACE